MVYIPKFRLYGARNRVYLVPIAYMECTAFHKGAPANDYRTVIMPNKDVSRSVSGNIRALETEIEPLFRHYRPATI
jgi:hypothetical protein